MSRIRSPITSRSNWAKERRMLSVSRPMLVVVLKACVTETKVTPRASNTSTSLAKSVTRSPILAASAGTTARWRSTRPACRSASAWRGEPSQPMARSRSGAEPRSGGPPTAPDRSRARKRLAPTPRRRHSRLSRAQARPLIGPPPTSSDLRTRPPRGQKSAAAVALERTRPAAPPRAPRNLSEGPPVMPAMLRTRATIMARLHCVSHAKPRLPLHPPERLPRSPPPCAGQGPSADGYRRETTACSGGTGRAGYEGGLGDRER